MQNKINNIIITTISILVGVYVVYHVATTLFFH
ncbi:hypothetical protein J3E06_001448 [Methanococcus voltae]|nr:hypothetical protein [Methanococcus voltae]